mmetsp:Transcript_85098/g.172562  ORF Transcript_85098/g.172562 Transcript_85098/m.172562 type:complete len:325 (-) Transcript_85098:22-996(-)
MTKRSTLLLISLLYGICSLALSFSRQKKISLRKNCRGQELQISISYQDLDGAASDDVLITQQETELWLDLRRTAIHPKAAIEQLEMQIGATSFVDRILLSERVFQNLIDVNDMYLTTSQIVYQSSGKDDLYLSSNQGLSTPFGKVSSSPSDAATPVKDPIQAIEVISGGKWLLLEKEEDSTDDQVESFRIDALGDFMDIVSSSSETGMWDSSPETNGLVLPRSDACTADGDNQEEKNDDSTLGGVAVACDTKPEVMKLACMLQLRQGGGTNVVTNSGIILQNSMETPNGGVSTAIVLPFSVDSWQVATLVFGKDLKDDNNDVFE